MSDLDIAHILCQVDPRMNRNTAVNFARRYFCCDPEEIIQRLHMIRDLKEVASAHKVQQGIDLIARIGEEQEHLNAAGSRLESVLYRWRRMAAYVKAVRFWDELCSLKKDGAGSRFSALSDYFHSLRSGSSFTRYEKALTSLAQTMPIPHYVTLGMNLRDDGYPVEMSVLGTSGTIDLTDEENTPQEDLNSMLSFSDPSKPSLSLGPDLPYTRSRYGSHFEEYISRSLEHQWKNQLGKAEKILSSAEGSSGRGLSAHGSFPSGGSSGGEGRIENADALQELIEPLSFYQVGMLESEAFMNRGYTLCEPVPEENASLTIRQALYPDFILEHTGIQGNDLTLEKGSAVLITGANHSGKTSYLKTIGQCFVLAQLGFYIPAAGMRFSPVHHIFTLFSAGEDSSMNASRMGLEVQKLTSILKTASSSDLVLLNEPMTSTNPVEAVTICADITRHFLECGITHLMVTHLYDVYFLLKAKLPENLLPRLDSLVTDSSYDSKSGQMHHTYRLYHHEPLGNSYARETAVSYGITLENMISDPEDLLKAEAYCSGQNENSLYEREKESGISDERGSGKTV